MQASRELNPSTSTGSLPADQGLAGLGLLMQLGGSVFLAYGAFMMLLPMMSGPGPGDGRMQLFLLALLCIVRSVFHRNAGMGLLYGHPKGPLHNVWIYIGVSVAQSLALFLILGDDFSMKKRLFMLTILLAWPIALAAVLSRPRFRRIGDSLPRSEDLGFESAAIMMLLFGVLGAMTTGLVIITIYQAPGFHLSDIPSFLWICVVGMLFVRSILHAQAGQRGCQGMSAEDAGQNAGRYFNFAIMAAIIASAVLMLQMVMQAGTVHMIIFASVGVLGYLLLAWPLLLRNFFTDRNFAILLEENFVSRRAPDTGLTALGWILFALGAIGLATGLASVFFLETNGMGSDPLMFSSLAAPTTHSPWWGIALAGLQTAAGLELIGMTERHKWMTSLYGAVSIVVTLYLWWPLLKLISEPSRAGAFGSIQMYGVVMISLAVALSSLYLVHRNSIPNETLQTNS